MTPEKKAELRQWCLTYDWTAAQRRQIATVLPGLLDEIERLRAACQQALVYVEGDEVSHGRQFGTGNALRAALAGKEKPDGK